MTDNKVPVHPPPFKTADQHIEEHMKTHNAWMWPFNYLNTWLLRRQWATSGLVISWNSFNGSHPNNQRICYHNKALVRGDGKILSPIDTMVIHCGQCTYFADVTYNRYLKGIESLGMYKYE